MNYLVTDTTDENLVVAVVKNGEIFSEVIKTGKSGHSKLLLGTIDKVLSSANIKVQDLDYVATVLGPGSFTGIRIGVATSTAIAYSVKAKRIGINVFEVLLHNRKDATVAVDAGHGNLYVAYCKDGKVESSDFLTADAVKNTDITDFVTQIDGNIVQILCSITADKIRNKQTVSVFEPYYMRKSQAERNLYEI